MVTTLSPLQGDGGEGDVQDPGQQPDLVIHFSVEGSPACERERIGSIGLVSRWLRCNHLEGSEAFLHHSSHLFGSRIHQHRYKNFCP